MAEILSRLVPLLKELGINVRWDVMTGGNDFFEITKAFHNALHGAPFDKPPESFHIFLAYNEQNRARLEMDAEFTVIHDPQPVALINGRQNRAGHWIWRCHIDWSQPNPKVWKFLEPYVLRYDGALFSSPDFTHQLPIPQYLFYPSIDPLSEKNRELEPEFIRGVLDRFEIDPKRPILTQISRFDRLKDPVGVVEAYKIVKNYFDCQLVLAGGGAADDPEGAGPIVALEEVRGRGRGDRDERAGPDGLDEPRPDEGVERGCGAAQERSQDERSQAAEQERSDTPAVGQPAGERHRHDRDQEVAVDDPGGAAEIAPRCEVRDERGERDGRHHQLQARQEHGDGGDRQEHDRGTSIHRDECTREGGDARRSPAGHLRALTLDSTHVEFNDR